jgi:glycine/D-amino acid oxidase-like deaminating enzyme
MITAERRPTMPEPFPLEPSLWAATAPPPPQTEPLGGSVAADACIVGAGYAGLACALGLAERGVRAVVLEARAIGFGGSGRNGGQVIPGIKADPDAIEARHGAEAGRALAAFVGGTADRVFGLISRHGMEVPHVRRGWIQGAHTERMVAAVAARCRQWQARGADVALLDRAAIADHLGTDRYHGGWLDRRGGAIQPLAYARGLARAALAAGAAIHTGTRASAIVRDGGTFRVRTESGAEVRAGRVVVATGGYPGGLVPGLRESAVYPNSFQIATEPLSDNVRRSILPHGQVTSDTRTLLLYFRLDHEGRFLLGGRGAYREPRGKEDWAHLERVMPKLYPQLAGAAIAHRWCGRVSVTRDFLPHVHEPEPGLFALIGCMGRGVGLQTAMGEAVAEAVATGRRDAIPFPVTPIRALPLHALHELYVAALVAWYRLTESGLR